MWYICIAMGARSKCRRAGASNGTCPGIYSDQYRPLISAPAERFRGTYTYLFVVHMHRDGGTTGKRRHAGAGIGTYTGTYFSQHRPLAGALAQQFCGSYMYHFMLHASRYKGTRGKCRRAGTSNGTFTVYRCGRTIGHLTVGDFAVTGVPL